MVRREQVNEFMHDHKLTQVFRQIQQFGVERKATNRRKRCPLRPHPAQVNLRSPDADLCRPMAYCPSEFLRIVPTITCLHDHCHACGTHTRCNLKSWFTTSIIFSVPTSGRRAL